MSVIRMIINEEKNDITSTVLSCSKTIDQIFYIISGDNYTGY